MKKRKTLREEGFWEKYSKWKNVTQKNRSRAIKKI